MILIVDFKIEKLKKGIQFGEYQPDTNDKLVPTVRCRKDGKHMSANMCFGLSRYDLVPGGGGGGGLGHHIILIVASTDFFSQVIDIMTALESSIFEASPGGAFPWEGRELPYKPIRMCRFSGYHFSA